MDLNTYNRMFHLHALEQKDGKNQTPLISGLQRLLWTKEAKGVVVLLLTQPPYNLYDPQFGEAHWPHIFGGEASSQVVMRIIEARGWSPIHSLSTKREADAFSFLAGWPA